MSGTMLVTEGISLVLRLSTGERISIFTGLLGLTLVTHAVRFTPIGPAALGTGLVSHDEVSARTSG